MKWNCVIANSTSTAASPHEVKKSLKSQRSSVNQSPVIRITRMPSRVAIWLQVITTRPMVGSAAGFVFPAVAKNSPYANVGPNASTTARTWKKTTTS